MLRPACAACSRVGNGLWTRAVVVVVRSALPPFRAGVPARRESRSHDVVGPPAQRACTTVAHGTSMQGTPRTRGRAHQRARPPPTPTVRRAPFRPRRSARPRTANAVRRVDGFSTHPLHRRARSAGTTTSGGVDAPMKGRALGFASFRPGAHGFGSNARTHAHTYIHKLSAHAFARTRTRTTLHYGRPWAGCARTR